MVVWPVSDTIGKQGILSHARKHFPKAMEFIKKRRIAIQAGGNVGVYPLHLSEYFDAVHTFEPDPENFACLQQNIKGNEKIYAHHCALGSAKGKIGLYRWPGNCGMACPIEGDEFEVCTIDGFGFNDVDLIWLDVEGYETKVLEGAKQTIERCRPVLIFENIGLGDSPRKWAESKGYKFITRIKNDDIMSC